MRYRISKSIIIPILIAGTSVSAQGSDLLPDGGFDLGIAGWHLVGRGSLAHAPAEGAGAPGSLRIVGGLAGDRSQAIAGYCLASLPPGLEIQFAFNAKIVTGTPAFCRLALFESDRSDCRWISLGSEVRRTWFSTGWNSSSQGNAVTGIGTRSIEVRLHCGNADGDNGPLEVLFDDVQVTSPAGLIFADDFELGSTERWSATVP